MDRIIRRKPADWRHSVAFTGHRPQKLPFGFDETDPRCVDFKRRLCNSIEMMILEGYTHFISGGALGMDMYAAEAVLTLREQVPGNYAGNRHSARRTDCKVAAIPARPGGAHPRGSRCHHMDCARVYQALPIRSELLHGVALQRAAGMF